MRRHDNNICHDICQVLFLTHADGNIYTEDVKIADVKRWVAVCEKAGLELPPQILALDAYSVLLETEVTRLREAKDGAYAERNHLVAALSKLYPASLERHPEEDKTWEDDWRWVVFVDLPTGQASWHIHDSELPQFAHLPRHAGRRWDGHTTTEKYARLAALTTP